MGPVRFKWLRRSPRTETAMPSLMRPILGADASPNVVRVALTAQMMLDKDALERGREEHISLISQRRSRWNCVTAARIADQLRREGLIA